MKKLFILMLALMSLSAFAGGTFYKSNPKMFSHYSEGFELKYDAKRNKCVREFWDGSYERASKDVLLSRCQGFIDAIEFVKARGANCNSQEKLVNVKTVLGVTAKEQIILRYDCVCYKHVYVVGEQRKESEFLDIKDCEEAFGEL